jgi:hypothetical protein
MIFKCHTRNRKITRHSEKMSYDGARFHVFPCGQDQNPRWTLWHHSSRAQHRKDSDMKTWYKSGNSNNLFLKDRNSKNVKACFEKNSWGWEVATDIRF